ncbi:hypothetical protein RB195_011671 [Necator americanus]|uniref:Uncharacterized protein n=1 Tax=Necator americanus TaxID=51031 RepID=A0ABR1D576_NECAM
MIPPQYQPLAPSRRFNRGRLRNCTVLHVVLTRLYVVFLALFHNTKGDLQRSVYVAANALSILKRNP